ncbi:XRE family transcriptional regulator [Gemmobacter lutimaris]|uniref:XRE family transcriptional regulator n=1 Tax=Gemmobacter lutimaris TaxID=2306023 RepID=A0A398BI96_9RHOB|nr:helix-turn-helix transcriptional regulator [Gemmobacter lutimaris]RID90319.1 XRE family transcriptional regulator [Gemmobacter lutimaris]
MTHEIDHLVGRRIRQRRWFTGLTQQELAESVGVKFQQIQKYETGANRVSASRLWMIGESLEAPVSYFFTDDACTSASCGQKWQPELPPKDLMLLVKLFSRLSSDQKEALLGLARTMAI